MMLHKNYRIRLPKTMVLMLLVLIFGVPCASHAANIYTYASREFTNLNGPPLPSSPALDTHLTIQFTYDGDLAAAVAGAPGGNLSYIPFIMSCGELTLSSTTPGYWKNFFIHSLSSSGLPLTWGFSLQQPLPYPYYFMNSSASTGGSQDSVGRYFYTTYLQGSESFSTTPGTWTVTSTVPVPASLVLFCSGLLGLTGFKKKIKNKLI